MPQLRLTKPRRFFSDIQLHHGADKIILRFVYVMHGIFRPRTMSYTSQQQDMSLPFRECMSEKTTQIRGTDFLDAAQNMQLSNHWP